MDSWTTTIFFAVSAGLYTIYFLLSLRSRRRLPPSPWGLPLVGHLHMLGDLPHRSLQVLAKKYGPIMSIRLGLVPAIVISSADSAELFLKTHDTNFANRPKFQAAQFMAYGHKHMAFAEYGPYWQHIRKLCIVELLSNSKIELSKPIRTEELHGLVALMKKASDSQSVEDVSAKIGLFGADVLTRMIFGRKGDWSHIKSVTHESATLAGAFNLADYIPFLGGFDLQGFGPRMKVLNTAIDDFLEKIIHEHVRDENAVKGNQMDFVDTLLSAMDLHKSGEFKFDRDNVKAIILDMLAGGMDNPSTAIEWVIADLLKHPRVMKLVQNELQNAVGLDRLVEETDLSKLEYLKMVIMESMRIHPVAPLLIPRESIEDVTINGYFIPKKTRVIINAFAIGRDPKAWSDNAEEFYPERFLGSHIDVHGRDFQLLPFGSGRRQCPGIRLSTTLVELTVAQLIHCFDFVLPNGQSCDELDMSEKFGLAMPKASHLLAIPRYRLSTCQ